MRLGVADLQGGLLRFIRVAIDDDRVGARRDTGLRRRAADAAGAAGDDRNLSIETKKVERTWHALSSPSGVPRPASLDTVRCGTPQRKGSRLHGITARQTPTCCTAQVGMVGGHSGRGLDFVPAARQERRTGDLPTPWSPSLLSGLKREAGTGSDA